MNSTSQRPITNVVGEYNSKREAMAACELFKSPGVYWRPVPHPTAKHRSGSAKYAIQRQT